MDHSAAKIRITGLEFKLARCKAEAEETREHLEGVTRDLIEMAAQLQSEIDRNARLEAMKIGTAQADLLAQAAATLRHEINNPLFVIYGTIEGLIKRLEKSAIAGDDAAPESIVRLKRILSATERIKNVVEDFSVLETPVVKEYLPGVSMLQLGSSSSTPTLYLTMPGATKLDAPRPNAPSDIDSLEIDQAA